MNHSAKRFDLSKVAGLPFGIGSLPHTDPSTACAAVLKAFPQSPFWPELPRRDWRESMGVEQARALPGFKIDETAGRIYFDSTADTTDDLGRFYEAYLSGDTSAFAISADFLAGFNAMMTAVAGRETRPIVLKGQLTGPTTLGLVLKDDSGKALLYHEQMMDVLVKATAGKAAWMARTMGDVCDQPAVFFDEPMLQSIGSAAIPIHRETAVARFREIVDSVDCVTGGHCCGNTDWSILIEGGVDIIAFDAWQFTDTLALYAKQVRAFLDRGGLLAWGIVPASAEGAETGVDLIYDRLLAAVDRIAKACAVAPDQLIAQSLVTPSCGLGSLTEARAENILAKTAAIAARLAAP